MTPKIALSFIGDSDGFHPAEFMKSRVNHKGNIEIALKIHVYQYDEEKAWCEGKLLFVKKFTFEITKMNLLRSMVKFATPKSVEEFFEKFFPESNLINHLIKKGEKYLSTETIEPVYFDSFRGNCEFIEVEEDTDFYGNFEHNGKEGCALSVYYYEYYSKKHLVHLSGNDDDSWGKYFDTKEEALLEMERLRRIAPISKNGDIDGYGFTN